MCPEGSGESIDPSAHRRGIGRALYTALFDLLRRPRDVNAYAGITLPNPGSEGLHTSLGFSPVGVYRGVGFKCGAWHDILWLHLRLRHVAAPESDPLAVADVWTAPGVAAMLTAAAAVVRESAGRSAAWRTSRLR